MNWDFDKFIDLFEGKDASVLLHQGKWGIEKEFLRVNKTGELALTPHPEVFGDKLTNPLITTDYSESQVEIITPPFESVEEVFEYLEKFQSKIELGIEYAWPMSMPCDLPAEDDIPIARYGDSKQGQAKEKYRKYLAKRYGKKMQMVCGMHYNFSFADSLLEFLSQNLGFVGNLQEFKNEVYFSLGRNFLRYKWLFIYLFGASPVVDKSYETKFIEKMDIFGEKCPCLKEQSYYLKDATSLRMIRLGYSNTLRGEIFVSYNSLEYYINDIKQAISNKELINESEYYSLIRFKPKLEPEGTVLSALEKNGVNHIEIRAMDLNPFLPLGVSMSRLYFCQILMIFCLFEPKSPLSKEEKKYTRINQEKISLFGRGDEISLINNEGKEVKSEDWMEEIFGKLLKIAKILDKNKTEKKYEWVVERQKRKIKDKSLLPSAKILAEMEDNCESFLDFGVRMMNKN